MEPLVARFHWDNQLLTGIELKKKQKLTDIGFFVVFPGLGKVIFKGFGFMINVREHQSTSGTKIYPTLSLRKSSNA